MTLALAPFCCAAVGVERDAGFERDADFERGVDFEPEAFDRAAGFERAADFDRDVGLDCVAGFDRDDVFAERLEVLFAFGAEPLEDPLLDFLRVLLEAGLLLAILIPLLDREHASLLGRTRSHPG